jgi:tetratricopeptide (TPR) repeat protein
MKLAQAGAFAFLTLTSSVAWSIGDERPTSSNPTYQEAVRLIEVQRYGDAMTLLKQVVKRSQGNADAYNYLGYASRKLGDLTAAFSYYRLALQLDPNHLGANEYLGELYAEVGDLQNAQAQLVRVGEICRSSCHAFTDLETAIRRHQPGKAEG